MKTLYLIDGHSQIFRAYHATRPWSMTAPNGEPTWATHVFVSMLLKFVADKKPDYLGMTVDGPRKDLKRTEFYPEYKAHRPPPPDGLADQEKRIFEIVEKLGIPILRAEGYEADDVLATLADRFASPDMQVVIVSRDKDLDQLVCENVLLYDPMKDEMWDAAAIEAKKGYPPCKAVEVQTLMGDSTDNIPGVPGIGPKTAAKLIAKYGSADAVLAAADEQTPKLRENLNNAVETIKISRELVTLNRAVPIDLQLDDLHTGELNIQAVEPIFEELGFSTILTRYGCGESKDKPSDKPAVSIAGDLKNAVKTERQQSAITAWDRPAAQTTAADFEYTLIDTPQALDDLVSQLAGVTRLAVDTETTGVKAMWCSLVGISLAWQPGRAFYIPVQGPLLAQSLDVELVREKLGPILADASVQKIGHNFKYDQIVLENAGFVIGGPENVFDTMIAAHVLDSGRMSYKMDNLADDFLNHRCIPISEVIGSGRNQTTMNAVPTDTVAVYAAEDADVTLKLADVFSPMLKAEGLDKLFAELEMPLLPVLTEMERRGIRVDPQVLKAMEVELSKAADEMREQIIELAGRPFNPDSPKQLAEVMFDEMQLPVLKKTKTGPSTDSSVLSQLAEMTDNPLPALVLDYRQLVKLISTYLVSLAENILPKDGRVHTSFHQAAVATGRLSSSDPNLQNIPIRTEQGRQIRAAFVAADGCMLLGADYSQVELRMLAHLCHDPRMLAAFADDQDIHKTVASEVFGVPLAEVTSEQRSRAKGVNFGIVYGQTGFGLSRALKISRTEATEFITRYKQKFPNIDEFLADCVDQARNQGYVETIFGRRRNIPEIDSSNKQRQAMAERLAINSVVQGSAADLIKQAMINISRRITAEARPAQMLLQIHDELLFDIPAEAVADEREMIVHEMTNAIKLTVPLKVDVGVGKNWLDAK